MTLEELRDSELDPKEMTEVLDAIIKDSPCSECSLCSECVGDCKKGIVLEYARELIDKLVYKEARYDRGKSSYVCPDCGEPIVLSNRREHTATCVNCGRNTYVVDNGNTVFGNALKASADFEKEAVKHFYNISSDSPLDL